MRRLTTFFMCLFVVGTLFNSLNGQNIAYVGTSTKTDAQVINGLSALGYNVTVNSALGANLDAGKAAALNAYDLVIIGRANNSGSFAATYNPFWQTVTTPVLNCFNFGFRALRAQWFETAGNITSASNYMIVNSPEHPIFKNTYVNPDTDSTSQLGNENSPGWHTVTATEAGNGHVLASSAAADGYVTIVEWAAGTEMWTGRGVHAGLRMIFGLPGDVDVDALSEDGMLLLTDIVEYMINGTVSDKSSPTDIQVLPDSFPVNTPLGAPIGELSASDPQDNAVSYALVAGEGDDDNASFLIDGLALILNANLDTDGDKVIDGGDPNLSIRVKVTDATGKTFEKAIPLTVTAFFDGPLDILLDNASIFENEDKGTLVGVLSASDIDDNIKMYELVEGTGDEDNASFLIDGDLLKSDTVFNYENKTSFSVRIMVTDSTDQSLTKVFTIEVLDIDESPTDIFVDVDSIAENLPAGTKVATLDGTDPQDDIVSFSLIDGDGDNHNSWFYIDGDSLYSNAVFDYEFFDTLTIRIRATDSEGSYSDKNVVIDVIDQEDVVIPTTNQQYRIALITSNIEGDAGYEELLKNNGYVVDASSGFWRSITEEMADSLNSSYDLIIITRSANSSDFQNPEVWQTITTPIINMSAYVARTSRLGYIETNTASGTVDTAFVVQQPWHPVFANAPVGVDSILAGISNENLNGNPWVNGNGLLLATFPNGQVAMAEWKAGLPYFKGTGVLAGRRMIFQGSTAYNLTERGDALFLDAVEYMITGSIGAPNKITIDVNTIIENTTIGAVVDTLEALDRHGDVASYALVSGEGDEDNTLFAVDGDLLKVAEAISYEEKDMLSIRVQVVDADGNTYDEIIEFVVQDISESPYGVVLEGAEVTELVEAGVFVGKLIGLDEDEDAEGFALVDGDGADDNSSFVIDTIFSYTYNTTFELDSSDFAVDTVFADDNSIVSIDTTYAIDSTTIKVDTIPHFQGIGLYTTKVFDFEAASELSIRVQVTDATNKTFAEVLSITVIDVDENPSDVSFTGNMFTENNAIGDVIGVLTGVDPQDDIASYELTDGPGDTNNHMLTIDGTNVKAAVVFDYETLKLLSFRVKVIDVLGNSYEEIMYTVIIDDPSDNNVAIQSVTADNVMVYPNPSSTGVFRLGLEGVTNAKVIVSDLLGRVVVNEQSFNNQIEINLTGMPAGNYIATIVVNNQVIVKKLINE